MLSKDQEQATSSETSGSQKDRYKLAILAPTCFYYQVPLFRQLAAHKRLDLKVYFCSKEALHASDAREMYKTEEAWGDEDELLVGYDHKFLKNYSPTPSYLKWPLGLINFGIWKELRTNRPDIVVLMSWMNLTWWIAITACLWYRIPFLYMTDANVHSEQGISGWKRAVKWFFLGKLVFKLATGFLCAGVANRMLYQLYHVPDEKLVPFAYSWGYETHLQAWEDLHPHRTEIRVQQGIPVESFVVLYCGRLSQEKSIFDLLQAYEQVSSENKSLILVGNGELKNSLEEYIAKRGIKGVQFPGFKSRSEISKYYATADLLVLPSKRETWGMVVNEALCFRLPVITSDQVGSAPDLINEGENGYIYRSGDVASLVDSLQRVVDLPENERLQWGMKSQERIKQWIDRDLAQSLDQYFDWLYSQRPRRKK